MASHSRFIDALGAIAAFAVVAATVSALGHRAGASDRPASTRRLIHAAASAAAPVPAPTSVPPTAATSTPAATVEAPTTVRAAPAAPTTVAPTTVARTTVAPTSAAPTTTIGPQHRWAVGLVTLDLVDSTRSTPAAGSVPVAPSRSLPTVVRYPADGPPGGGDLPGVAPSRLAGPYPLIVFAHGFDSSPSVYADLLRSWTAAGYVVAAPAFPRGLAGGPLDEADLASEPADISFVITRLVAANATPGLLAGVINPVRIGVAGHSDGGVAALGVGFNTCCRDARISADMVGSADEQTFTGSYFPAGSPPLLVIQGDHDPFNAPSDGRAVFVDAHSPKYFLWLVNAGHIEPFSTDQGHLTVVENVSIAFFDRYLKAVAGAAGRMQSGVTPALATLTAG